MLPEPAARILLELLNPPVERRQVMYPVVADRVALPELAASAEEVSAEAAVEVVAEPFNNPDSRAAVFPAAAAKAVLAKPAALAEEVSTVVQAAVPFDTSDKWVAALATNVP